MNQQSIMHEYINETQEKMINLLNTNQIDNILQDHFFKTLNKIIIIGSGSSYHAAFINAYKFEKLANIQTFVYVPSNIHSLNTDFFDRNTTLVIGISQMGTSLSTINAINKMKDYNYTTLTITADKETPLHHLGDHYLNLLCGEEESNAKTKGYSNTLLLLEMLSIKIGTLNKTISDTLAKKIINDIETEVKEIPITIKSVYKWLEKRSFLKDINNFVIIGQQENYGSAMEGALKLMETTGVIGSYCDTLEFSHGVHRTIISVTDLYLIVTDLDDMNLINKTIKHFESIARQVIVINASSKLKKDENYININHYEYTQSVRNVSIVFQILSAVLPELNNLDPNRNLNDNYTEIVTTRK